MSFYLKPDQIRLRVAKAIHSLPPGVSSSLVLYDPVMLWQRGPRPCDCCGTVFIPAKSTSPLQRFCTRPCSMHWHMNLPGWKEKKYSPEMRRKTGEGRRRWLRSGHPKANAEVERIRLLNPTSNPATVEKIRRTLKLIGHKPPVQGGNGHGPTIAQQALFDVLEKGWAMEFIVHTGPRTPGIPTHYKIDIAHPETKTVVEVDGLGHSASIVKERDRKKTEFLVSRGWTVLRFSNRQILDWTMSGMPTDGYVSTILRANGITPSVSPES